MNNILDIVRAAARQTPDAQALVCGPASLTYRILACRVHALANALCSLGIPTGARIAIFLDKRIETVISMLGAAAAQCVFVPINPLLKPQQVAHVLRDCSADCLITTALRARVLDENGVAGVHHTIIVDDPSAVSRHLRMQTHIHTWPEPACVGSTANDEGDTPRSASASGIDTDLAAILYTSGSTGLPKGVMLSHRNLLEGAWSVSHYLRHTATDRILAVLPLSFDAGLSQLTSAWYAGAAAVLINYVTPQDVIEAC